MPELLWRYKEGATGHDSGFQAPAFDDSSWATGYGPFARNDPGYYIYNIRTPWVGADNDLCARAHLTVAPGAAAVTLIGRIDYSASVYVNGTLVASVAPSASPRSGVIAVELSSWLEGDNVIAVRAHADVSGENYFALVAAIDLESPAIAFDVYQIDPPGDTHTFLATLDDAEGKSIRPVRNEPGSGMFSINRNSPNATAEILAPGNLVKVRIPAIDPGYIFAFFMEQGDFKLVASDEEGGEVITIGGRGGLSYWDRAIWLSEKFVVPWWDAAWGTPPAGARGHVTFEAGRYRRYTIVGGEITGYSWFTTAGFEAYFDTRQTYLWPSAGSKRFLVHLMAGETHAGWYVHPHQDGVTETLPTYAVGTSTSVLLSDISPDTPGEILVRLFAEATDPARPTQPVPLAERWFTETADANGDAWATTDALAGLTAELGDTYLTTIAQLVSTGAIDVESGTELELRAYNSQGRDLTGTTFGTGKVRFVKGVNVADELRREREDNPVATFIEVVGTDNMIGRAVLPDAASRVAREISGTGDSADETVLEAMGLASLNARLIASDAIGFRIATGDDEAAGLYLPGPDGTANGRFWLGDIVTLHTGTGDQDFNQEDERVYAITIAEDDGGNLEVTPEVGSVLGEAERRLFANETARTVSFTSRSQFTDTEVAEPPTSIVELPWYDVTVDGACVGDGVTDDTVALQAAIADATASGTRSATLYFPPGTYLIGGALQDTGAFNGQILLPDVDLADPQITIAFRGAIRPPLAIHGDPPDPAGYSIIRSTLTGASGTASVISGGNGPYSTYQNNLQVVWEDLILVVPANPTLTGLNLEACQGGIVRDNWFADAGWWYSGTNAQPTHSNSYGYKLPGKRNSWYTIAEGNGVIGFYTGFLGGELMVSGGGVGAAFCIYAMELPEVEHLNVIQEFGFTACTYGIRITGQHPFRITAMDMQHDPSPAWAVTVADLYDPSNLGYGDIGWWSGNAVLDHTFTKNGGANVHVHELGAYPQGYPVGPAGGDLSGTYPNPSVVDDSHSHTAATAPGSGSSGGGDHTHIVDEVFSGDGATTVFPLANSAVPDSVIAYISGTRTPVTLGGTLLDEITFGSAPASASNNISVDYAAATS